LAGGAPRAAPMLHPLHSGAYPAVCQLTNDFFFRSAQSALSNIQADLCALLGVVFILTILLEKKWSSGILSLPEFVLMLFYSCVDCVFSMLTASG
jgi:hypothetical protein